MLLCNTKFPYQFHHHRTFIAAKIKWVRDGYLDKAVSKEKNLKQAIFIKNQILFSPSKSVPLSSLSLLKPQFNLPTTALKFLQKYPYFFTQFQPSPSLPVHAKLSPFALAINREEQFIHKSSTYRDDAVNRLAKLLMLTRVTRLPLHVIDRFKFDLGLPHDYITSLLSDYPEYFHVCEVEDCFREKKLLHLELVSWRNELAVSEMEKRAAHRDVGNIKKGERIGFSLSYPNGYDLKKKVQDWVFEWQGLPYISPYENASHLNPNGDQAEKWVVAVFHELLWLLVSKKTEKENLLVLGDYLGLDQRFKKALVRHPGIFYVSNKIRTQTVVLREAYRKDFLLVKHPLMGMRFRYIHLMNKTRRRRSISLGVAAGSRLKVQVASSIKKGKRMIVRDKSKKKEEQKLNCTSDNEMQENITSESEFEDAEINSRSN